MTPEEKRLQTRRNRSQAGKKAAAAKAARRSRQARQLSEIKRAVLAGVDPKPDPNQPPLPLDFTQRRE